MLAFLHTARVHVANFERITRDLDGNVSIRHSVREDLLEQALADGGVTAATRASTQSEVKRLISEGARVVICTCSTLGSAAEETPNVPGATVLRVDRPMVEHAISLGRPILLVAATPTALAAAVALFDEVAGGVSPAHRQLLCAAAWERFRAGDQNGYAALLAREVDEHARSGEVVVLAQASMACAVALVRRTDIEILTSPDVSVRAALALLGS